MLPLTGSNAAPSSTVHGAGTAPLGIWKCHVGVPVNVSVHRSLKSQFVVPVLPPWTTIWLRPGSNAATCRERAAGPPTMGICAHASGPVSASAHPSLSSGPACEPPPNTIMRLPLGSYTALWYARGAGGVPVGCSSLHTGVPEKSSDHNRVDHAVERSS